MFYGLRKLYHPEFYQGPTKLARYFEGWYYKAVVDGRAFALIPGVSRAKDDPHAFIQYIDGEKGESSYHRYPLDAFSFRRDQFEVRIESNRFALDGYSVDLPDLTCNLEIAHRAGWPSTLLSPGTMGWYSFVPFMECRHGIIIMDAQLSGTVDGRTVDEGRLYVEKDYGRSFPNAWIWLQSNSFEGAPAGTAPDNPKTATSVTCSIANVPFVGGAFTGFLAAILHNGELHRFTTYTGAKLTHLEVHDHSVDLRLEDRRKSLHINARREEGATLAAPASGVMSGRIVETIRSSVFVDLVVEGRQVYSGTGTHAGLEVINTERLETA